jgi:hypothetical protein
VKDKRSGSDFRTLKWGFSMGSGMGMGGSNKLSEEVWACSWCHTLNAVELASCPTCNTSQVDSRRQHMLQLQLGGMSASAASLPTPPQRKAPAAPASSSASVTASVSSPQSRVSSVGVTAVKAIHGRVTGADSGSAPLSKAGATPTAGSAAPDVDEFDPFAVPKLVMAVWGVHVCQRRRSIYSV